MRVEDLDPPRVRPGSETSILRDHEWLGLDWDEGPTHQSKRGPAYAAALAELRDKGLVYPCTCTRREIAAIASAPHGDEGARYPGTCREGPTHPERPAAFRFRMSDPSPGFEDALLGAQGGGAGGDFIIRRADGLWAYQLAVVVDDAAAGITEVIRGADLLSSTPRQLALYRALGADVPGFLHVPLVVDEDGGRLAKRFGSTGIDEYRDAGFSPEALLGLLAESLGIRADRSPTSAADLIDDFDLSRVPREPFALPRLL